ncbi:hypothetical protein GGR53DRAFT_506971 [Hypoxylon sp. FL1150]|nr:hypothetical protein GGR53DRAFT_506971 [Hypoxylon sp. FL1150]
MLVKPILELLLWVIWAFLHWVSFAYRVQYSALTTRYLQFSYRTPENHVLFPGNIRHSRPGIRRSTPDRGATEVIQGPHEAPLEPDGTRIELDEMEPELRRKTDTP